mmetsp:Transcript_51508/g.102520  ORF Transcript_51508/g.102520 Transcript_51508/m.102520 type:complete len:148 (-) Transcript_51508:103-546(-)
MRDAQPDPSDPHANANQQVGPTCIHVHAQVESEVVTVEFDNRGCDCEWKLYWVNPTGERLQYGTVPPKATQLQQTFPGHVWQLERSNNGSGGAPAAASSAQQGGRQQQPVQVRLYYSAARDKACVATVTDDAGCAAVHISPTAEAAA